MMPLLSPPWLLVIEVCMVVCNTLSAVLPLWIRSIVVTLLQSAIALIFILLFFFLLQVIKLFQGCVYMIVKITSNSLLYIQSTLLSK